VHGPVDRHCVVSQSASCVDLTGIARPMAPCPVEILHKQIFLFISTVQHLGNITDYGQRLMEEQVCHPGSVGDLGEGLMEGNLKLVGPNVCLSLSFFWFEFVDF